MKDTDGKLIGKKLDSSEPSQVHFNDKVISFSVNLRDEELENEQKLILVIEEGVAIDAEARGCPAYSKFAKWPVIVIRKFMFAEGGHAVMYAAISTVSVTPRPPLKQTLFLVECLHTTLHHW